ncbi:MAG: pentapeptide repeat-containing protein [Magnetococcales bacterium]|nr:pentapeptide repeat-containing protein [Magnetococcales bacterium]
MSHPLSRDESLNLLEKIIPALKSDFRAKVEIYKNRLRKQDNREIPLQGLLMELYPGVDTDAALARFRNNFKKGINQHLAAHQAMLFSQTDNRPIAEKTVRIDSTAPQVYDQKIMDRVASEAKRFHPDTPSELYIPQAAITAVFPFIAFPERVLQFLQGEVPDQHPGLPFVSRVGAKLDAIVQASPTVSGPYPLIGFELLGLGPHGESFNDVIRHAGLEPVLVKFALAVAGVETARFLLDNARYESVPNFEHTRFTLNLDREMFLSPVMPRFVERYGDLLRHHFLVEINEDLTLAEAGDVLRLVQREGWRVVLDDLNDWDTAARALFEKQSIWTKVSHKAFQKLALDIDVDRAMRQLQEYVLPGKPLVVEGVEREDHFRLLVNRWQGGESQPLYIQGHGVKPGPPWERWLLPLREFNREKKGGGYIAVSSRVYAETMKILNVRLPESALKRMRCRFEQEWAMCEIPREKATLRLLLPTRNDLETGRVPFADQPGSILVTSQLRVGFDQSRQVTLERLADALDAWLHGDRLSRLTLEQAAERRELYKGDRYVASGSREGEVESLDARQVLLHWLKESNRPYCAVLGDYGIGKTFLCREFTREVHRLREGGEESLPAPLYLDLRDFHCPSGSVPKLEEMMRDLLVRANMPDLSVEGVLAMVRAGHLCVIFDGFDEKSASMSAQDGNFLLKEMRRTVPAGSPGKVLIASRTHYFLDRKDEEMRIGGGVRQGVTRDGFSRGDFRLLYLLPFDEARILAYLERVFPGEGQGILATFRGIHDLMELSIRPFLLQLIAGSLERIRARVRPGIKVTAGDIYASVVEEWLARDQEKMGILHYTIPPAMEAMARFLWGRDGQACPHKMLFQWQMEHASSFFSNAPVQGFTELHDRLNTLLRTASFLSRDGEGNYRFAHTSFLEFFLARFLVGELVAGRGECLDLPALSQEAMRFLLDLLATGEKERAATTLVQVLAGRYQARVSENSLHLALLWQREQPESAPRPQAWNFAGANLEGVDLAGARMEGMDFAGARLVGADLTGARLRGSLRGADLSHVRAARADLTGCDLTGCDLSGANLAGANLSHCRLDEARLFSTFLQRADLRGSFLARARFSLTRLAWSLHDPSALTAIPPERFSYVALPPGDTLPSFLPHIRAGYRAAINAVAFSPDGSAIVSAGEDHTLKLWDASAGVCIRTFKGHDDRVTSVAFRPDGAAIVSAGDDHTLKLWDARSGVCIRTLKGHSEVVTSVAFRPDGAVIVSAAGDHTLKLWDPSMGSCIRTFKGHTARVHSVAFSPDGSVIVSAGFDKTLKLWDASTGDCIKTFKGHTARVHSVAFSPDGSAIVSAGFDKTVKLWDASTGACIRTFHGHHDSVTSVAFSPDGVAFVSASNDITLKLWDAGTGVCIRTLMGHDAWVTSVAFSQDGAAIVSAGEDKTVKLWGASTGACIRTFKGDSTTVNSVGFSPDGAAIVSAGEDTTVKLWDANRGACIRSLKGHGRWVNSVACRPDGAAIVSAGFDNILKLWDASTGTCIRSLKGHEYAVNSVAFSPDGAVIVSAGIDQTLKFWDASTGACIRSLKGHHNRVTSVAFSPDGAAIVSASNDQTLKLWDVSSGGCTRTLKGHDDRVASVAFRQDGAAIVSAGWDKTLKLWDVSTGVCIRTLNGHDNLVTSVAFSPDGEAIVSAGADKTLKLWDVSTGICIRTFKGHDELVRSVAFSLDGRRIVSAGENIRLWNAQTGEELVALWGWEQGEWVAFSPDGRVLACNSGGLAKVGFVHNNCVYPGEEFAGCFPEALPHGL